MTCRCAERGSALVRLRDAALKGDFATSGREARFVAQSMVEDAKRATQAKLRQARARLSR